MTTSSRESPILDFIFYCCVGLFACCTIAAFALLVLVGSIRAAPFMLLPQIFLLPLFICVAIKKNRGKGDS